MHNVQYTMHNLQCTKHNAQCVMHTIHCTMQMYNAKFSLHNLQCIMHNATPSKLNLKTVFANGISGMSVFSKAAGPLFPQENQ